MASPRPVSIVLVACLGLGAAAEAQEPAASTWLFRSRLVGEIVGDHTNQDSPLVVPGSPQWDWRLFLLGTADSSWTPAPRLKLAGGVAMSGDAGSGATTILVREAYLRWSTTDWLDVEAGKRVLKWGTGYAFTPTGLLDPPRNATDPEDRLGVNEGVLYAGLSMYRGVTAVSLVAAAPATWRQEAAIVPAWTAAARVRTMVHGFEVAFVASASQGHDAAGGMNFTHVIGRRLEWHGEVLVRDRPGSVTLSAGSGPSGGRLVSALIGCQYTFDAGASVVVEVLSRRRRPRPRRLAAGVGDAPGPPPKRTPGGRGSGGEHRGTRATPVRVPSRGAGRDRGARRAGDDGHPRDR